MGSAGSASAAAGDTPLRREWPGTTTPSVVRGDPRTAQPPPCNGELRWGGNSKWAELHSRSSSAAEVLLGCGCGCGWKPGGRLWLLLGSSTSAAATTISSSPGLLAPRLPACPSCMRPVARNAPHSTLLESASEVTPTTCGFSGTCCAEPRLLDGENAQRSSADSSHSHSSSTSDRRSSPMSLTSKELRLCR